MKRKVVVRVSSMNGQKSRSKALKIVVAVTGVESATVKGKEMDQIEVTGNDIDPVAIAKSLRKKVGFAELVAVAPVEEKKAEDKEKEPKIQPFVWPSGVPYGTPAPYYVQYNDEPACCSIM